MRIIDQTRKMDVQREYSVLEFVRSRVKSNLCRFLFCATAKFSNEAIDFFRTYALKKFDDRITGLLIVYPNYIVHLIEFGEDEMLEICENFANSAFIGVSRCFPVEINVVGGRFFDEWHVRKVDGDEEFLKIGEIRQIKKEECWDNLEIIYRRLMDDFYRLCDELRKSRLISPACLSEKLDMLGSPRNVLLPSEERLERILESPWGDSLESFVEDYRRGVFANELDEEIWPFPRNQCPFVPIDAPEDS